MDISDNKMKTEDFQVTVEPKSYQIEAINNLVGEDMKISESITKSMQ